MQGQSGGWNGGLAFSTFPHAYLQQRWTQPEGTACEDTSGFCLDNATTTTTDSGGDPANKYKKTSIVPNSTHKSVDGAI
jgi:hypothetical protein